ncbi:MAG: ribosomal subunit interface protein [Candidatus Fraserbacteria bacterium RBG_16_55_9]|uniref:Ribosomal subunit interface protein n=1 Tax=Fraserbacteria sp. (strain RBG_16_55_9) TaxID=1817864 RepID=A0A1F5UPD2_FRAXR|nr:MAG: ribosomal subunit interface protein [Candidatus Fraserbacteria bacterium RBG_16_55_9]
MKITLAERHMQASEALRSYAVAKVEHLSRYFNDGIISVDVMLEAEKERQICELVAHLIRKKILKASAEAEDMHAAVDAAIDRLKTQLSRYKGRLRENRSKGRAQEVPAELDHPSRDLQRVQVYLKKPMTPEEAILQLESYQKKDFLIFMDAEREALSVLRRLSDGRYELLEPVY